MASKGKGVVRMGCKEGAVSKAKTLHGMTDIGKGTAGARSALCKITSAGSAEQGIDQSHPSFFGKG